MKSVCSLSNNKILSLLIVIGAVIAACTSENPHPITGYPPRIEFKTLTPLPSITPIPPSNTPFPTPPPTLIPSITPTPSQTKTPTQTTTPTALPPQIYLGPLNHQWQTLNNCHRASIATLMGFYNVWMDQHEHDLGMDNLAEFVSPYGLTARIYMIRYSRQTASDIVRWLLAEEIPVIVGQDLTLDDNTWHYRVVHGYNDDTQEIIVDDPLLGPDLRYSYEDFNELASGVGQFIPVYPKEHEELIQSQMKTWEMKLFEYP